MWVGEAWKTRAIWGKEGRYKSVAKPDRGTNAKADMEAALRLEIVMCFIMIRSVKLNQFRKLTEVITRTHYCAFDQDSTGQYTNPELLALCINCRILGIRLWRL